MRRKALLGLVGLLVFASLVGLSSVGLSSEANVPSNALGMADSAGVTRSFTFTGEGQSRNYISDLDNLTDRDKYVMNLTTRLTITVVVADCCLMNDTIAIFYPYSTTPKFSATSPKIILGSAALPKGVYTFWVGYMKPHTMVFPAGYYIWIIASHG